MSPRAIGTGQSLAHLRKPAPRRESSKPAGGKPARSTGGQAGASWRTIQCKFAAPCPRCGERLEPGSAVRWAPGHKAYHLTRDCSGPGATDEAVAAMGDVPTGHELAVLRERNYPTPTTEEAF